MTNRDSYIPGRNEAPGTNSPRHVDPAASGWGTGIATAIVVLALIVAGTFMWANSGGHGDQAASNPAAQTTGQGGSSVSPSQDQSRPSPMAPAGRD